MRVFTVLFDSDAYRGLEPVGGSFFEDDPFRSFAPVANTWAPPEITYLCPRLKRGNFAGVGISAVAADAAALAAVGDLLQRCSELLPVRVGRREYHIVHVLNRVDALDPERTEWAVNDVGERYTVRRPAFRVGAVPADVLFKIPEGKGIGILTATGLGPSESEFKARVEHLGLTGLYFEELWSDEG